MRSSVTLLSAAIFSLVISFSVKADPMLETTAIINDSYPAQEYANMNIQLQYVTGSTSCQNCPEDVYNFASYRQQSLMGNLPELNTDALSQLKEMNLTTIAVTAPGGDYSVFLIVPSTVALLAIACGVIVAHRPQRRHRHRL